MPGTLNDSLQAAMTATAVPGWQLANERHCMIYIALQTCIQRDAVVWDMQGFGGMSGRVGSELLSPPLRTGGCCTGYMRATAGYPGPTRP